MNKHSQIGMNVLLIASSLLKNKKRKSVIQLGWKIQRLNIPGLHIKNKNSHGQVWLVRWIPGLIMVRKVIKAKAVLKAVRH